jgi:hypothetical protein
VPLDEPLHAEPSAEDTLAPPPEPVEPATPDFPPTEVMASDEPAAAAEPADPEPLEPEAVEPPLAPDDQATQARPLPPLDDDVLPPEPALPDPEPEHQPPPSGDSDDVLEETPDFLQDTPDHDRLWFEQRPPRDFDFDD